MDADNLSSRHSALANDGCKYLNLTRKTPSVSRTTINPDLADEYLGFNLIQQKGQLTAAALHQFGVQAAANLYTEKFTEA